MTTPRENLLTPEELCGWLKVKTSWLYQHIHSKDLPFPYVKIGRYVRFPESGVLAYLKRQAAL
jgi:excisionase family DNA binding protein